LKVRKRATSIRESNISTEVVEALKIKKGELMPKYVTIGYGDRAGYDKTPEDIRNAAHKHDRQLLDEGALLGIAGTPVQVRNTLDAKVETTSGAFMSSSLPVAGFAIIEAEDLSAAIRSASKAPCAVAYGVVEVWPLEQSR
jgi:hypothetical protein